MPTAARSDPSVRRCDERDVCGVGGTGTPSYRRLIAKGLGSGRSLRQLAVHAHAAEFSRGRVGYPTLPVVRLAHDRAIRVAHGHPSLIVTLAR
jgi:hypothetical protein